MKTHFTILADDLSGAADCAVPFARAGFRTEVFLHPEIFAPTDPPVGAMVLGVVDHPAAKLAVQVVEVDQIEHLCPRGDDAGSEDYKGHDDASHEPSF